MRFSVAVRFGLILGIVALLWAGCWAGPVRAKGPVELVYFFDQYCSSCAEIHTDVIQPLQQQYGEQLRIVEMDIADEAAFELLLALEEEHAVSGGEIPEVFIGDQALVGPEAIEAELAALVERALEQGGVALPAPVAAYLETAATAPTTAEPSPSTGRAPVSAEAGQVHLLLFWSPTCGACHKVIEQVLPPIQEQYGDALLISTVSIATEPAQEFWFQAMGDVGLGGDSAYIPMLFVGEQVLIGSGAIAEQLPGLIESHLAAGGLAAPPALAGHEHLTRPFTNMDGPAPTAAPVTPTSAPPIIHAVYFSQVGCDVCDRAERDLDWIEHQYPQLQVEHYDVREYAALNEYLAERVGLEERLRLVAPSFFVGDAYLIGADVRAQPLRTVLEPYLETGAERFWEGYEEGSDEAERSIVERFRSLNVLAVVGAGLLDGVNPCAFATMIFLVSYLTIRKRARRELLLTGIAFTAGVFLAYLGIGVGLFRLLDRLPALQAVGRWIYLVTAALCLLLAWGSLGDYRKAKQGRLKEMTLKLPDRLTKVNRKLIREGVSAHGFVLSSFALGMAVSLIELACTGQVYLPTIVFVLGVPGLRTRATLALVLYNLMFVLPLVVVFLLVYWGTTSQQLVAWMKRRTAGVKLATGVLFLLLSAWLIYSVVATAI